MKRSDLMGALAYYEWAARCLNPKLWDDGEQDLFCDSFLYLREETVERVVKSGADMEKVRRILKQADEILLKDPVYTYITLGFGVTYHDGPLELWWHNYFDWIVTGKLDVVWDKKRGIYIGVLKDRGKAPRQHTTL